MSGRCAIDAGDSGWPSATPIRVTSGLFSDFARSLALTITAAPPSLSRLQSNNRNGSEIMREA
jgi:hypothetical protein